MSTQLPVALVTRPGKVCRPMLAVAVPPQPMFTEPESTTKSTGLSCREPFLTPLATNVYVYSRLPGRTFAVNVALLPQFMRFHTPDSIPPARYLKVTERSNVCIGSQGDGRTLNFLRTSS